MTYRATAAYPYINEVRAMSALRGSLREMAARKNASVDWTTLQVAGPDEVVGAHGRVWYEWTATAESVTATDRTLARIFRPTVGEHQDRTRWAAEG